VRKTTIAAGGVAVLLGALSLGGCASPTSPSGDATVAYPEPGKTITMIIPFGAGGGTDIGARMLGDDLGRILDTTVVPENVPGASGQIGLTELVSSAPDGYTISWGNAPITSPIYLDPSRGATFGPDDLVQVANYVFDPSDIIVAADSPYENLTDLVDAAKAQPGKITLSSSAVLSPSDFAIKALEKAAGVDFNVVYFDDPGQQRAATLGGQVAGEVSAVSESAGAIQSGEVKAISVFDSQPSKFLPGVPTAQSEGFDVEFGSSRIIVVPKGTPDEIVNTLSAAIKKAIEEEDAAGKFDQFYLAPRYMDPAETKAYAQQVDEEVKAFLADSQ